MGINNFFNKKVGKFADLIGSATEAEKIGDWTTTLAENITDYVVPERYKHANGVDETVNLVLERAYTMKAKDCKKSDEGSKDEALKENPEERLEKKKKIEDEMNSVKQGNKVQSDDTQKTSTPDSKTNSIRSRI